MKRHEDLLSALKKILCVPFSSTCETLPWLSNDQLHYFDKSDAEYKRAVMSFQRESANYTLEQICALVDDAIDEPMWYARDANHYFSIEESLETAEELLEFQYGEGKASFLKRLYNITEKNEKKRNAMFVQGPANSGKSYFFDMICAFYLNVGHVANMNKSESFPFNDCVGRRILMWNEPNIQPSSFDAVKMITGNVGH